MRAVERAVRAELRTLPEAVRTSAVARVAIDLAARLDEGPADTAAVLLARELRQCMSELRAMAKGDATSDVEDFLRRVSTPAFDAEN
jgi:hypothetical protein